MLKQTKLEDKTVKSTQLLLVLVGLHDFQIFLDRTAHVWNVEVEKICSISVFSSKSAVKYLHVGQRKIHISPPLVEQDQLNALPQGQQRQSNPHPMPCLPPTPQPALQWCTYQWFAPGWEGGQPTGNSLSCGELISTHNSLHCSTECLQRETITWWQNNGTHKLCALPQV